MFIQSYYDLHQHSIILPSLSACSLDIKMPALPRAQPLHTSPASSHSCTGTSCEKLLLLPCKAVAQGPEIVPIALLNVLTLQELEIKKPGYIVLCATSAGRVYICLDTTC